MNTYDKLRCLLKTVLDLHGPSRPKLCDCVVCRELIHAAADALPRLLDENEAAAAILNLACEKGDRSHPLDAVMQLASERDAMKEQVARLQKGQAELADSLHIVKHERKAALLRVDQLKAEVKRYELRSGNGYELAAEKQVALDTAKKSLRIMTRCYNETSADVKRLQEGWAALYCSRCVSDNDDESRDERCPGCGAESDS